MARKYKANRARGTRQEHYKETVVSGYIIPRMPKKGGKDAYLKAFIEANEEVLQSSYDSAVNQFRNIGEEARFKEQNPDIAAYVKRYFGKGRLSKK